MEYKLKMQPKANAGAVCAGENYRFTVLTSRLIRIEYSEDGNFEDRATQMAINRNFDVPDYRVVQNGSGLEIITKHLRLVYNGGKFEENSLSIHLRGNFSAYHSVWYYGDKISTLGGTARTLDEADGAIELEEGLISSNGFSVIDDSRSCILLENGWVEPREQGGVDLYYFGYGREYKSCLKDFFHLSGRTPLLPRYVLGNWWSRFHPYTEESYHALLERFAAERVPFSIAVLDMDWHVTKIDPKYGSGWTGYTWNKRYFENPKRFLKYLHDNGMHVTLNVHPAEGVRACEEAYEEMAKALGVNIGQEEKIDFDVSDPKFLEAYFKYLHHPNEEIGVDFWWVDWQQKGGSKKKGYDPLFILNHCHYLDSGRDGRVPLTFSRYAGLGSHRYPIGFSGDTFATWESLDFQPYFTATASNAGYGWWSHDIGGHMHGTKSDEMFVRWVQFGVFSPIMRIHSSDNPFFVKEPWAYNSHIGGILKRYLRLRHQLIPYLYTMNYRCFHEGEMLTEPMYYRNPECEMAYRVKNEYYFGTNLIVCPITKPMDEETRLAEFAAWLPQGTWYDLFTGDVYRGNRSLSLYRGLENIPVLAAAGSILPLTAEACIENSAANPKALEVCVFNGASGEFTMYEDNLLTAGMEECSSAFTKFVFEAGAKARLIITAEDRDHILPQDRKYTLHFYGVERPRQLQALCGGREVSFRQAYDEKRHVFTLSLDEGTGRKDIEICLESSGEIPSDKVSEKVFEILDRAQIAYDLKKEIYELVNSKDKTSVILGELHTLGLRKELTGALLEVFMD